MKSPIHKQWAVGVGLCAAFLAATTHTEDNTMNRLAERYVRLVLAVGQHDADYVDAYYGPPDWRKEAAAQKLPLADVASRASALAQAVAAAKPAVTADELTRPRHQYLARELEAGCPPRLLLSRNKLPGRQGTQRPLERGAPA